MPVESDIADGVAVTERVLAAAGFRQPQVAPSELVMGSLPAQLALQVSVGNLRARKYGLLEHPELKVAWAINRR